MKKSTKGALAAGAAAALLLGGAGSLAYWTDAATVNGGQITSGSMDLTATDCSSATWLHIEDDSVVTTIVPGDTVYKVCSATSSWSATTSRPTSR